MALKIDSAIKLKCTYSRNHWNIQIENIRKIMQVINLWYKNKSIFLIHNVKNRAVYICLWAEILESHHLRIQMTVLSYLLVQSGTKSEKEIAMLPAQVLLHVLTQKIVNYGMLQKTFK